MSKEEVLHTFEALEKGEHSKNPSWIRSLQKAAISRFMELGFPTLHDEEWKYTNLEPLVKSPLHFTFEPYLNGLTVQKIKPFLFDELDWNRLVFVNGIFSRGLSFLSPELKGVRIGNLRDALHSQSEEMEPYLAQHADFKGQGLTALNTAFIHDGAFLSIPKGKVVEKPIHLLFLSSSGEEKIITQPRNLIVVGEEGKATVVESFLSLGGDPYFTNAVTEIFLSPLARLTHYKIQRENSNAFHVATTQVACERDSTFTSHALSMGAQLSRNNLNIVLNAEGSECALNGLYLVNGRQHTDHHTLIDHTKPNGTSRQLYKGILDGRSRAVFSGKILVHQDAQHTDAHQTNKNLLLSEGAVVDTKPQLEIFADDVKCTHGAAVGELDEAAVFYAKSRGLSDKGARNLLTHGFANEVIQEIKIEAIRSQLDQLIWERLREQNEKS